ncbi:MAG TPA: RDD family protein, partial [Acidimicrobiia bacterium]
LDALVILAIYFGLLVLFGLVRFIFTNDSFRMPQPGPVLNSDLILVVGVVLLTSAWSGSGRAPGMAVVGLRVVSDTGERLSSARAFGRALLVMLTLGIGLVTVLFSRRNQSLYDMVCRTASVYDWRPKLAESRRNQ